MGELRLAEVAVGPLSGRRLADCVPLPVEGDKKRGQSCLLHGPFSVRHSDSATGKHAASPPARCQWPDLTVFSIPQIRGLTLPGAARGISFYTRPDWGVLLEPAVWGDAASQIFYSFGLACNSLVSFASYSQVRTNRSVNRSQRQTNHCSFHLSFV